MSNAVVNWAKRLTVGSQTKKAVLLLLADFADDKGRAWPSQEHIAAVLEMGERTVRGAIKDLVESGIITRKARWRPDGTRGTDILRFDMDLVNRQEPPLNGQLPANGAATTGRSRQDKRQEPPKHPAGAAANTSQEDTPVGNHQKTNGSEATASGLPAVAGLPVDVSIEHRCWIEGKTLMVEMGASPKLAGDMIGQWIARYRDHARILDAIRSARAAGTENPIPLVVAILDGPTGNARASPNKGRRSSMVSIALKEFGTLQ